MDHFLTNRASQAASMQAAKTPDTPPRKTASAWPALADSAPKVASYSIDAKLDSQLHRIAGRETIHFVNRSSAVLKELWFHLYLNAFKNDKSLFLRSPFGAGRSGDKAHEYGYVDVRKMRWVEAEQRDEEGAHRKARIVDVAAAED